MTAYTTNQTKNILKRDRELKDELDDAIRRVADIKNQIKEVKLLKRNIPRHIKYKEKNDISMGKWIEKNREENNTKRRVKRLDDDEFRENDNRQKIIYRILRNHLKKTLPYNSKNKVIIRNFFKYLSTF